jgi:hypothetical protein
MGRSFLFREARPKVDVPGNLGFERKRLKGLRLVSPSQITAQRDSQIKNNHGEGTFLRDKTTIKLVRAVMVNTS